MLSASWAWYPSDDSSGFSWSPMPSPSMLSTSNPTSTAGATLRMLVLSSALLVFLEEPRLRPKYDRTLGARNGLGGRDPF